MKSYIKTLIFISIISVTILIAYLYYNEITYYNKLKSLQIKLSDNTITAKQIEVLLSEQLQKYNIFANNQFTLGEIYMNLNLEHRGSIIAKYVERNSKYPKVVFVYLDTEKSQIEKVEDMGTNRKLYPGEISIKDWLIDSDEAVKIAHELYSKKMSIDDFHYDEVLIYSYNGSELDNLENVERWLVFLIDSQNGIKYFTRIDPFNGNVVSYSIW